MKTLKQEDFTSLKNAHDVLSKQKDRLAELVVMQKNIGDEITKLIHDIPVSDNNLRNVEDRISKDYKAVTINMSTGEYTCDCPDETMS